MNIANIANIAFHSLNEALTPTPEPSLEEILAGLRNDLEDAEARLYCAQMRNDPFMQARETDRWQKRLAAIRRHIQIVEGL